MSLHANKGTRKQEIVAVKVMFETGTDTDIALKT
jgi:hypothetical protein